MKRIIISGVITFTVALLAPQIIQAQGAITYLSNLGQTSTGNLAVGSDSWVAAPFSTGTNTSGYTLDSIQLAMTGALGNPSNFTVMLYGNGTYPGGVTLGSSLGTLNGSLNPVSGGIFTYTPASNLTLSPLTYYSIVITSGTAVAGGAYDWSNVGTYSYNPSGGWASSVNCLTSSDGSSWRVSGDHAQFAINATPIPEPGVLGLIGLGGFAFLWHRRKAKAV